MAKNNRKKQRRADPVKPPAMIPFAGGLAPLAPLAPVITMAESNVMSGSYLGVSLSDEAICILQAEGHEALMERIEDALDRAGIF